MEYSVISTIALPVAAKRVGIVGGAHSLTNLVLLVCASGSSAVAGVFGRRGRWTSRRRTNKTYSPEEIEKWQRAMGSITGSRLVWNHIEISYEFLAMGKPQQGKHEVRLSPVNPDDLYPEVARRHEVNALLNRYARGTAVAVRYDPANPEQSILIENEAAQATSAG